METVPLTYAQNFINFVITRIGPNTPALFQVTCARVRGHVDPAAVRRAAVELAARHPVICARLDISGDELVQRQGPLAPSVELIDLAGPAKEVDAALSALADKPFDLCHENPLRIMVGRGGAGDAFLMLQAHHLFIDSYSLDMLLAELVGILRGDQPDSSQPRPSSTDSSFFAWARRERAMIDDGTFDRRARDRVKRLSDADPVLHLPGRGAEPALKSTGLASFDLAGERFQRFADRARQFRVSNFALAAAAVFRTLREVTGSKAIALSVVSGARQPPFGRTIGQFAGVFVITQQAADIDAPERSARLAHRDVMSAITDHVPVEHFRDQVGWLRDRTVRGYSFTDAYINYFQAAAELDKPDFAGGLEVTPFPVTARVEPPGMPYHGVVTGFSVFPKGDSLSVLIEYEPAIVNAALAGEISAALQRFLTEEA